MLRRLVASDNLDHRGPISPPPPLPNLPIGTWHHLLQQPEEQPAPRPEWPKDLYLRTIHNPTYVMLLSTSKLRNHVREQPNRPTKAPPPRCLPHPNDTTEADPQLYLGPVD